MRAIRDYLNHRPCLRGQILDRGELKRVAQACGLPQEARSELRKLGFILTKNNHGLTIWKRQDNPVDYEILLANAQSGSMLIRN